MGKGRPRYVEKRVLGQNSPILPSGSLKILPLAPVYYPTEDEFKDPLGFIYKIRGEAEPFGICKIVPPDSWKPPFALDLDKFRFPTKSQAIHKLQVRPPSCDPKTFELEYDRFLEGHCGKKLRKRIVFEGDDLDLCTLFNAVKRYGGYNKVMKEKKWGDVSRLVKPGGKISGCAKHVLSQLYCEHLSDFEDFCNSLNRDTKGKSMKGKDQEGSGSSGCKRRRKNLEGESVKGQKVVEEVFDQICEQCNSGLHGEVMLLCDRCNKGWHLYCLSPPLKQIPPGNWYCLECVNSDKDSFGFVPGKKYSLEGFRRLTEKSKRKWFGSVKVSRAQMEKKFWEIVEGLAGEVEVMYGSDLDTSVYGSGFPRADDDRPLTVEIEKWNEYCDSPWNLNNLPKLHGSMLRAVHQSIAGVMVPWLYIGMMFSSFCWHFEDHCFYSMNYHHWGEPKCWYSVPGSAASSFEKVMRNTLPDLFDAQPDLLFQLVTMLNPSVLVDNGVPVYSVLQEPGNFVITFPRSYHGGFNFGLNCAEAVNFAPADWLPHGRFGADLYKKYHKAAVLSHEELLCVVAKSDFDSKAYPYLNRELLKIYDKEKTCREQLWRNGILRSSPMPPRKNPEYVGTEEDPTCIICQQYLYLSAVVCRCRPSTFVCLEHWEHLCECKPQTHQLLYRHTLADLRVLALMIDKHDYSGIYQDRNLRKQLTPLDDSGSLTKKVKSGQVTMAQLSEKWLLSSCKILQIPYCKETYAKASKEAEQFLWAGPEMDPVREMLRKLIEARKWAEDVKDSFVKIKNWSAPLSSDAEKVNLERLDRLFSFDPVPCDEPAIVKLKDYHKKAQELHQEICSALSTSSKVPISDLENLFASISSLPISIDESEKLIHILNSAKVWVENVRKIMSDNTPTAINVDVLYKLEQEISELPVQLPEVEILTNYIKQVENCRCNCIEMLKGPICLKKLKAFLQELDDYTVSFPELKLLREYHSDAISWISRYDNVLVGISDREDQENVVHELTCIQRDGECLKVKVGKTSLLETELKKACCRAKAQKALSNRMTLEYIQPLINEATILQIEKERLFSNISGILEAAIKWEENATQLLASEALMSSFKEAIRTSDSICAILPSLDTVQNAVILAESWLKKSKPFLVDNSSLPLISRTLLEVQDLKELVSQSKLLKVTIKEKSMLHTVLEDSLRWKQNADSSLLATACLLNTDYISNEMARDFLLNIEKQTKDMELVINAGLSFGLNFDEIPKLQNALSALKWCSETLKFCAVLPQNEDVGLLIEIARELSVANTSTLLFSVLIDALSWLKKAAEMTVPCNNKVFKKSDVEEILDQASKLKVSFPVMVNHLATGLEKHDLWLDQVRRFFNQTPIDRSWNLLSKLKEVGNIDAFHCSEFDELLSEVGKVEQWRIQCEEIVGSKVGDAKSLVHILLEIESTLERSFNIYTASKVCKETRFCINCSTKFEDLAYVTCSICNDCIHVHCEEELLEVSNGSLYVCKFCEFLRSGKICVGEGSPLVLQRFKRKPADLNKVIELFSAAEDFSLWIEERDVLKQLVEKALALRACVTEVLELALSYGGVDINVVVKILSTALKIVEVAGISDIQVNRELERSLARSSWKVRANKLLEGQRKASIQQVQRHLKEGLAICIPPEDHFWQKLFDVKQNCLQWADKAKRVSMDSGALGLDKVFELISEGESLPVLFEKELKLLRNRSMLYCICRKPYDQRAMIACDNCDEWYHFDCVKLISPPKIYICPACKLQSDGPHSLSAIALERCAGIKFEEPQTPSPRQRMRKSKSRKRKSSRNKKLRSPSTEDVYDLMHSRGIECLLWQSRKPFNRVTRKRLRLDSLATFSLTQ